MHAYDFILVLLSFVYAAAVTHLLSADLHTASVWSVGTIAFYFSVAAGIYLNARLVSPRIPETGDIDLAAFHADEGQKYLVAYGVLLLVSIVTNAGLGPGGSGMQWSAQNTIIIPMAVATGIAATFIRKPWVQASALAVQILGWLWYFAELQSALSG